MEGIGGLIFLVAYGALCCGLGAWRGWVHGREAGKTEESLLWFTALARHQQEVTTRTVEGQQGRVVYHEKEPIQ